MSNSKYNTVKILKEFAQSKADREEMEIATLATVDPREVLFDRINELDAEFSADIIHTLRESDEIRQGEYEREMFTLEDWRDFIPDNPSETLDAIEGCLTQAQRENSDAANDRREFMDIDYYASRDYGQRI